MRTTSAVLVAPESIELHEFPVPTIGEDDGLLRMELAGICGSDVLHWGGHSAVSRNLPAILGHEIVGRIEHVGALASRRWGVTHGDRVIVEASFGCGLCELCLRGSYQMCAQGQGYGGRISASVTPYLWGAYGQHLYLPPRARVHRIGDAVSPEVGVVIGAVLANGVRWVHTIGGAGVGDTVIVFGPGPQGLAAVIAAQAAGAERIVAVGLRRDRARLTFARDCGATHTLSFDEHTIEAIADLTSGRLADVVIDVTGSAASPAVAAEAVRPLGTFVMAGSTAAASVELPWNELVRKEVRAQGVNSHDQAAVRAAISLAASGHYPLERMVTHRFPLGSAGHALSLVRDAAASDGVIKAVLDPFDEAGRQPAETELPG
ncbi:MAG: alcohol dehydrogenase catalytic domain-containing protein [Chloroflexi bacterium]|nr:alcohol dehydrogenase catalytic domain-containing protein [Chloroflexota bacterium]